VNCHPGGALGYTDVLKVLEESDMLKWDEKNMLGRNFSRNPPYSGLPFGKEARHRDESKSTRLTLGNSPI
jgi:hypothetical protein